MQLETLVVVMVAAGLLLFLAAWVLRSWPVWLIGYALLVAALVCVGTKRVIELVALPAEVEETQ